MNFKINNIPIILKLIFLLLLIIFVLVLLVNKNTFTDSVFDHVLESYQIPGSTAINSTLNALKYIKNNFLSNSGRTIYNNIITRQNIFTYTNADNTEIRTSLFCSYLLSPNKNYKLLLSKEGLLKLYNSTTNVYTIVLGNSGTNNINYILKLDHRTSQLKIYNNNTDKTIWTNNFEYYGDIENLGTTVLGITNNGRIYIVRDKNFADTSSNTLQSSNHQIVWDMNPKTCLVSSNFDIEDFKNKKSKYSYVSLTNIINKLSNTSISTSVNNNKIVISPDNTIQYPRDTSIVGTVDKSSDTYLILSKYGYLVYYNSSTLKEFKLYSSALPFVGNSTDDAKYPFSVHIGPNYKGISKITDHTSDTTNNNYLFLYRHDNTNKQYPIDIMPITYIPVINMRGSEYTSDGTSYNIRYNLTSLNKLYSPNNTKWFGFFRTNSGIAQLGYNDTETYNSKIDSSNYFNYPSTDFVRGRSSPLDHFKTFLELKLEKNTNGNQRGNKYNDLIQVEIYQTNIEDKTKKLIGRKALVNLGENTSEATKNDIIDKCKLELGDDGKLALMCNGYKIWPQPVSTIYSNYGIDYGHTQTYNIYIRGGMLMFPTTITSFDTGKIWYDAYTFGVSKLNKYDFMGGGYPYINIPDDSKNYPLTTLTSNNKDYNNVLTATADDDVDYDGRYSKWIKYSLFPGECILIFNYFNHGYNKVGNGNAWIKKTSPSDHSGIVIHYPTVNYYTETNDKSDYNDSLKQWSVNTTSYNNVIFLESDLSKSSQFRYIDISRANNDILYNFNNYNMCPEVSALPTSTPTSKQDFYFGLGYTYQMGSTGDYSNTLINTFTDNNKDKNGQFIANNGISLFSFKNKTDFLYGAPGRGSICTTPVTYS